MDRFQPLAQKEAIQRSEQLAAAFGMESDRGLALVAAAFCDDMLETVLRNHFMARRPDKPVSFMEPLFEGFGPLVTLSAKIRLCYALDLFPEHRRVEPELDIIRKIRNLFAHQIASLTYGSPEITALTDRLAGPARLSEMADDDKFNPPDTMPRPIRSRLRFIYATVYVGCWLQAVDVIQQTVETETMWKKHDDPNEQERNDEEP